MSELAAILARRRRISDGNFLRQDKPVERDEEGDNVRNNDNNDNKNDDRNNNKEEETIIFPPPTPPPTPPPIVQIELDNNDLNSIDDLRKLAAETDNMAAEVLEKDNTDDKSTIDNNSTKNILRSPAWQPGDDKAAFEDSIKSTGGFITSSVVEVNQLKNNLQEKSNKLEDAMKTIGMLDKNMNSQRDIIKSLLTILEGTTLSEVQNEEVKKMEKQFEQITKATSLTPRRVHTRQLSNESFKAFDVEEEDDDDVDNNNNNNTGFRFDNDASGNTKKSSKKKRNTMDLPNDDMAWLDDKYVAAPKSSNEEDGAKQRPSRGAPGRKTTLAMMLDDNNSSPNVMSSLFASIDDENEKQRLLRIEEAKMMKENGMEPVSDDEEEDEDNVNGNGSRNTNTGDGEYTDNNNVTEVYSSTTTLFHSTDAQRNRGYRIFLDRLREPDAAPLLNDIKRFLMSVLMPNEVGDVYENGMMDSPLEERARLWFEYMEKRFSEDSLWSKESNTVLKMANEGLEKYVMTKLFKIAFTEISTRTAEDDTLFSRRRKILRLFLSPDHLEVHKACRSQMTVSLASGELNKLNSYRAPADKLQCIVRCCSFLFNQLSVSRGNDGSRPGADDFLPVLIYVLLNSENVPQINANLEYIQAYRNKQELMSKAGYCLVNLQSSVAFLTNVNGESGLKGMDKEEFDTKFAIAEKAVETGNYDEVEKWNVGLDDSLLGDD